MAAGGGRRRAGSGRAVRHRSESGFHTAGHTLDRLLRRCRYKVVRRMTGVTAVRLPRSEPGGRHAVGGRLSPRVVCGTGVVCGVVSGPDCGRSSLDVFSLLIARRHASRVICFLASLPNQRRL